MCDESEILAAYASNALRPVATKAELEIFKSVARATGIKDRRVNLRLSSAELQDAQDKALEQSLRYPTLIANILHEHVIGRLAERDSDADWPNRRTE